MKMFLINIGLVSLLIACAPQVDESAEEVTIPESSVYDMLKVQNPFNVVFDLEQQDAEYLLKVTMQLEEGSYYASPHSNNDFLGLFNIELDQEVELVLLDEWLESPRSVEEFDEIARCNVNWVREETTYSNKIAVNNPNDFKVGGTVSFVVEPSCNRYEVTFDLIQETGNLRVEKKETIMANL